MNLALIGHNSCAKDMSYSIQNLVITMNDFGVRMTDSEFTSDDDVNSLSDVCMENCVNDDSELSIDHLNLNKEWQEKISQIGSESLLCVRSLMDPNPPEE
ncbi:hypothetical protein BCV72DRAFT_307462 [Rhizopus microsporus var. microsporus]|uniref:Uncharacterized protein n=2 Tax=Rhizopus microsporus TaxID=58291 RepID=A0A2G4SI38_RHIZD|nr:uncharacterized protein RHIMIDRAFT_241720 [Rhizopus microsporus ATCC 52813]ORE04321.1 hypothetical protein BCV72DRAFT_307462 [Rhizopus microsporus var. microsporus]PHZ08447.1 hypothetical protein RHIMIDRAFT_241720 [Rhizopus microsporus ATCC 52813]